MRLLPLLLSLILQLLLSGNGYSQSAIIRGEESAGVYSNLRSISNILQVEPNNRALGGDPCSNLAVTKSSAVISITTATTTLLVAGSTTVYVCGFSLSISQVVTTANTIKFVRGSGATCGTGTADLTGTFGAGGVTAGAPITLSYGNGATIFKGGPADGICATTTIGASASFQGVLTYVQQ